MRKTKWVSLSTIVIFVISTLISFSVHAEYYMVYPGPVMMIDTAFADCPGPRHINVLRINHKNKHRYHARRQFYNISTYHMTSCQTWGYVWVPGYYNECGDRVRGHFEERFGYYYAPEMSSVSYSEHYYDAGGDPWPDYDRATMDDTSADFGEDP